MGAIDSLHYDLRHFENHLETFDMSHGHPVLCFDFLIPVFLVCHACTIDQGSCWRPSSNGDKYSCVKGCPEPCHEDKDNFG